MQDAIESKEIHGEGVILIVLYLWNSGTEVKRSDAIDQNSGGAKIRQRVVKRLKHVNGQTELKRKACLDYE